MVVTVANPLVPLMTTHLTNTVTVSAGTLALRDTAIPGAVTVRFNEKDIVRHPLVAEIVAAYDREAKMARGLAMGEG